MADDRTEDPTLLTKLQGVTIFDKPSSEVIGPSKVKELTEVKLRGESSIKFKFPRKLNSVLLGTRRLHLTDRYFWRRYRFSGLKLEKNTESLFIKSRKTLQWDKSSKDVKECTLPNLTDIHLESRWSDYALQFTTELLHVSRRMSRSLKFVEVESVQLGDVVMKSVEWSRTSSDSSLQIKGASAAVPIIDLIDLTTSDLKEVTVLTFYSCKIDFGQSESKSPQSPKELGSLREIRFVGSENPLSESDRNKLSELYPNVKVTENQTSQESSEESQEGAGIPFKLDKASSQPLKTSLIGSQNPEGREEETSWQEKEEEFDVNQGSLPRESGFIGVE
ncbi:uncharacterized protein LOC135155255 [Lytechinus pictus]|uniref:uncharacterized protein LOC135155255 n=1 Tax=Lytechinus pictus TaxID=7653 RepID=UPI0030B9F0D3